MADDVALQIEPLNGGSEVIANEVVATTSLDGLGHDSSSTQISADIDENGCTPLHRACKDNSYQEVYKLIHSSDASIFATDNDGRTPLHYACDGDDERIVELFIQKSAGCLTSDLNARIEEVSIPNDPDVQSRAKEYINHTDNLNNTPLSSACIKGHKKIVELLLKHGADVSVTDNNGNTPLGNACTQGHIQTVELLLKHDGVDINRTNKQKLVPLCIACIKGHTEIVELLLEHGANVNVTNNNGNTPIGYACIEGHIQIVKLLLEHGANVNVNDNGNTPIGYACIKGHIQIVKLLLEHGANINVTDNEYYTPLSIACYKGHMEIVKLLLEQKDTDVTICNKSNNNALDVAVMHGQKNAAMAIVKSDKWKDALRNHKKVDKKRDEFGLIVWIIGIIILIMCFWCLLIYFIKQEQKENGNDESNDSGNDVSDDSGNDANKPVKHFITPMRRIIQKMPDVAKVVFDRCCDSKKSPYDEDYEIYYNYEFIEDFDLETIEGDPSSYSTMQNVNDDNDEQPDAKRSYKKWPPRVKYSSQNHCLNILANSPSAHLLKHPLAATLLDHKWNKYGRIVYYTNLIFYFLFVILLTSYALTVTPPNSNLCMEVFGNDTDTFIEEFGNDTDTFIGCSEESLAYVSVVRVFMIIYSIIMLLRELAQVIQSGQEYFTGFVNYIEVSLFIFTIMFTSVRSNQCYCPHSWQWQIGVIAVFFSWIALIISIRKLPVVGIYVVMFIKIFNNFIKVVVLALLLISAFAIPLYMMFYDPQDRAEGIRTPFITPWRTFFKTITMTMGEFDMDSLLRQDNQRNAPDVQYPVVTFSLIIVFVILMPILFLNLLTSLAVGDTEEIRKSADAYRRTLRVEFTLPVEVFLRGITRRLPKKVKPWIKSQITVKQEYIVKPNEKKKKLERYISKIQEYFTTASEENVDEVKNKSKPLSEEMKDLHSAVSEEVKNLRSSVSEEVKDLRSSIDQLLAIVNSMNERQRGGEVRGLEEQ